MKTNIFLVTDVQQGVASRLDIRIKEKRLKDIILNLEISTIS